ncbi:MAG: DNA polymerase III subunit delta' [Phenylobacterium sp.]|uniref:DNA polymerase III subunit delta' n=1 Tax=Phenylobacterium sp. TaxID=1871053 RepID=UPI0027375CBE|nr:DNA polymerase III subunit delta' [Phenylobacterium sp.]MDP3173039.1 DNA polymerase III subunit delta' [Phenylobacterium sp.]
MAEIAIPHPRDSRGLMGHEAAEAAFEASREAGRLHHAWLLTGPEGVGKASFAYRAARRLLGATPDPSDGQLGSDPDHPVTRQVAARSHPDLMVLEKLGEDGKARRLIPVDEARQLPEFFAKSPASAPYRVAIVDAADDLNVNAANALLKTLEEPPSRGVLLLVSHAPGRLFATIRSRCRRLAFAPLEEPRVAEFVRARAGVDVEQSLRLARMSGGAPGRALTLSQTQALAMDDAARDLLGDLPRMDEAAALSLADRFRGTEGAAQFALLFDRLSARVHDLARTRAADGAGALDRWAQAWETLQRLPREVEGLNLDRADAFFSALSELRAAARD